MVSFCSGVIIAPYLGSFHTINMIPTTPKTINAENMINQAHSIYLVAQNIPD